MARIFETWKKHLSYLYSLFLLAEDIKGEKLKTNDIILKTKVTEIWMI